ncbi:phage terminase large subunit family protein [Roseomonas sp. GC11]|uniref:phage terminase large subunit family protein n=1 Tax=Roseomonas sp. GC11 TaxID=2950546 RepID=UPI002108FDE5|nr:terminase gpA endonuclease subunit [Roseomonas sp. GC11]MCQ4160870.1 phage terminase large subunit family protein [Roseomonas sp. GC11]
MSGLPDLSPPVGRLRELLAKALRDHMRPPPRMTVDEWADAYRILPPGSPEPGPWRTATFEVARGPMRAVTEPGVKILTGAAATQIWKTELILNAIGRTIHLSPKNIVMIQPKTDAARSWSRQRLAPMLRECPVLAEKLVRRKKRKGEAEGGAKARDSANSTLEKTFTDGSWIFCGSAQSATDLAGRNAPLTFLDEVGRFPLSAGGEGDPIIMVEKRAGNFPDRLSIRVSSPGNKGECRIWSSYLDSDQRRAFVPCPHCGVRQVMRWGSKDSRGGVKWSKDADRNHLPDMAAYACESCGCVWSRKEHLEALQQVDWRQCRAFKCCGEDHDPEEGHRQNPEATVWRHDGWVWRAVCRKCNRMAISNRHAGFWCSRLYSPKQELPDAVREFLASRGHPEQEKAFQNTVLAEVYEGAVEELSYSSLESREEQYPAEVPDGVVLLMAGVDVQENRLECTILGFGRGGEIWVISHTVFWAAEGDVVTDPACWDELDRHLLRLRHRRDGLAFIVEAAAVDSGGRKTTHMVYEWCHKRMSRRVWAVKGNGGTQKGDTSRAIWPRRPTLSKKGQVPFYVIGSNATKFAVRGLLATKAPGPRYVHFPGEERALGAQYFQQLTAERPVTRHKGNLSWVEWDCPDGKRNETWDCFCYAYAAYCGWVQANTDPDALDRLADDLRLRTRPSPAPVADVAAPARSAAASVDTVERTDQQPGKSPDMPPPQPPEDGAEPAARPSRTGWLAPRRRWL